MNYVIYPGGQYGLKVHHIVGPPGANGTQQFPKLTDYDLICILKPLINEKIINIYCNEGGKERKAQSILANLKPIAEYAKDMFRKIEAEHGYCSCECVAAMQRNQAAQGQLCDLVYRALMVCFTFADLQIQLEKISNKGKVKPKAPRPTTTTNHMETPEERLRKLVEKLQELHRESNVLHEAILHETNRQ